jgi:2-aminoadipate transaminase
MKISFADRIAHTRPSDIREILELTSVGGYLSFAGGIPDPALFPIEQLSELAVKVLRDHPARALQYGPTSGLLPLREKIAVMMGNRGVQTDADQVQIISGAQQGIGLSGTLFVNADDGVIAERPTYSAAINALDQYEPHFLGLESDDEGPIIDQLHRHLRAKRSIPFAYMIPNFQNPSGRLWSQSRRISFLEAFADTQTLILEDDPYGQLYFHGKPPLPLKASDHEGRVIYLGSFSKVLCPGLRVGWIVASPEILKIYNLAKQNLDLHTSAFDQELINAYLEEGVLPALIESYRTTYARRCQAMVAALESEFPVGTSFTRPEGGLFTWVELPGDLDARSLLVKALEHKVAFIPGDGFFATRPRRNTLRLNFSAMGPEAIREGIAILGSLLREIEPNKIKES